MVGGSALVQVHSLDRKGSLDPYRTLGSVGSKRVKSVPVLQLTRRQWQSGCLCILSLVLNHAKDIEKMLQKCVTFG